MTAACQGGSSQPKLGQELVVAIGAGRIAQLLELGEISELSPVIPFLVVPSIVLSHFCGSDPPAVTPLTLPESTALINLDFTPDFFSGLPKVTNYVLNKVWSDFCECSSGPATLPPIPPTPSGTPITQNPTPGTATPCLTGCAVNNGPGQGPCQQLLIPGNQLQIIMGLTIHPGMVPTAASVDLTLPSSGTPTPSAALTFRYIGAGLTELDHTFNVAAGWTAIHQVDAWPPGGYGGMDLNIAYGTTGVEQLVEIHESIWCNGTVPNGTQTPCCPPDTATQASLDAILKLVTLIQRQQVPFAYNVGPLHAGLTGNGQLDVQGLLGVKIVPTTIPPGMGSEIGDPDELWLESWITWGNADGWTEREWLRHAPHISLPSFAGQFTKLGYTFAPGMACDVYELVREP